MTNRRVGFDGLSAIEACRADVAAQDEYFRLDRDGNGLREYATKIISTQGKHDGLYGRGKTRLTFRRLTDLSTTPIWPGVTAWSPSRTTVTISVSSPRRGRRRRAARFPTSSTAT